MGLTMLEDKILKKEKHEEPVTGNTLNLFDLWVNKLVDNQRATYESIPLQKN